MAQALPIIGAVLTGASAYTGLRATRAEAKGLMLQASATRQQAISEKLKYKQQGIAVLDNILATQSAINARAGAGGIDPLSGSARALYLFAERKGVGEYYLTREGQTIAVRTGDLKAQQYVATAKATMAAGRTEAFGKIASFALGQSTLGKAPNNLPKGYFPGGAENQIGYGTPF
jgi:hypothetical protein